MVKNGLLKRLAKLINSDKNTGYRITTKCLSVVSYLLINHKETIYQHGIIKSIIAMLNEALPSPISPSDVLLKPQLDHILKP